MEKDPLQDCGKKLGQRVDFKTPEDISPDDFSYLMSGLGVEVEEIPKDVDFEVRCRVYPCTGRTKIRRLGDEILHLDTYSKIGKLAPCEIIDKASKKRPPTGGT